MKRANLTRLASLLLLVAVVISSAGCAQLLTTVMILGMGTIQESAPEAYGNWTKYHDAPAFLPDDLDGYTVNAYSYTLYNYFDICYEIFLDLTVTEEQFTVLIERAEGYSDARTSRTAYYDEAYTEIIFTDVYERWEAEDNDGAEQVGWADIDKIIYNPDTRNIIYVAFHANDTGVHDVENVAYFQRFGITPDAYVEHLAPLQNQDSKELRL